MEITIYQITVQSFIEVGGIDYAMVVDSKNDILLFTDNSKAEDKYNELVYRYVSMYHGYEEDNKVICDGNSKTTIIYHDSRKSFRTYISIQPKTIL